MRIAGVRIAAACAAVVIAAPLSAEPTAHVYEKPITSNRDPNMNRQVARGGGVGGSAIANSVVVSQQGRGNTLVLNVNQSNSGDITSGTALNGRLSLD